MNQCMVVSDAQDRDDGVGRKHESVATTACPAMHVQVIILGAALGSSLEQQVEFWVLGLGFRV